MSVNVISLIIVAAYLIGMLVIGLVVGKLKIKDSEDYMVAGRRMGLFMVAFRFRQTTSAADLRRVWRPRPSVPGG